MFLTKFFILSRSKLIVLFQHLSLFLIVPFNLHAWMLVKIQNSIWIPSAFIKTF